MPRSTRLNDIRDQIQTFAVEQHYEPGDLIKMLNIMADLVDEVKLVDAEMSRQPPSPLAGAPGSEILNALTATVTTLCQSIDPTCTHGPETSKIADHARRIRFAVRMLFTELDRVSKSRFVHSYDPDMMHENLRRLDVLDALDEPMPDVGGKGLLLDARTFPNEQAEPRPGERK